MWKWTLLLLTTFAHGADMIISPEAKIAQIAVDERGTLVTLNQAGELRRGEVLLGQDFATEVTPVAQFGRIALADNQQNLAILDDKALWRSEIKISRHAPLLALPLATIAVVREGDKHHIARIEPVGSELKIVAIRRDFEVLPDAVVVQTALDGSNDRGHLLVLGQPDADTYQHGVLGDNLEAKALYYLERHHLGDLAQPLVLEEGLVFEANAVQPFAKRFGVTTVSGKGNGARVVLIGQAADKLEILKQSEALPMNRWQAPFIWNDELYAVRMPHLVGELVRYHVEENQSALLFDSLGEGYSNHKIHDHNTNLSAISPEFALIPKKDYQTLALLSKNETTSPLSLPKPVMQLVYNPQSALVWALLTDGSVWQIKN